MLFAHVGSVTNNPSVMELIKTLANLNPIFLLPKKQKQLVSVAVSKPGTPHVVMALITHFNWRC
jgi:hypothetical protein